MNRLARRARVAVGRKTAAGFSKELALVPESEWPQTPAHSTRPFQVWKSRRFVVLLYDVESTIRVSVRRTDALDGITWEELQEIKTAIGFGPIPAVEYFPPDDEVVNVANMRHLWILSEIPSWAWRPE